MAIRAWNTMNGMIDWTALPVVCEMLGITDIETLVSQLMAIRDHMREKDD